MIFLAWFQDWLRWFFEFAFVLWTVLNLNRWVRINKVQIIALKAVLNDQIIFLLTEIITFILFFFFDLGSKSTRPTKFMRQIFSILRGTRSLYRTCSSSSIHLTNETLVIKCLSTLLTLHAWVIITWWIRFLVFDLAFDLWLFIKLFKHIFNQVLMMSDFNN